MTVALIILKDGRDEYHERSVASAQEHLPMHLFSQVIVNDDPEHTMGFAGAIEAAWSRVNADWVFHLEADFTFNQWVPVGQMIDLLRCRPELVQVALKRQPWNEQEKAAGGIVEQHSDDFTERADGGYVWTEHRRFFTTNPCVYRGELCARGWPQVPQSEGIFTHQLLADPTVRFAFWGGKFEAPRVHHIGDDRKGGGY